jgi:hypothetical protein
MVPRACVHITYSSGTKVLNALSSACIGMEVHLSKRCGCGKVQQDCGVLHTHSNTQVHLRNMRHLIARSTCTRVSFLTCLTWRSPDDSACCSQPGGAATAQAP